MNKPTYYWVGRKADESGVAVLKLGLEEYHLELPNLREAIALHNWIQRVYETGAEDAREALLHRMYAVLTEGEK